MEFFKGHGLGNDYLVVPAPLTPARARRLCARTTGLGADGVVEWDGARAWAQIWNPDGSRAERSGNGLRVLAAYLYHHGQLEADGAIVVRTPAGPVELRLRAVEPSGRLEVEVDLGAPRFGGAAVHWRGPEPWTEPETDLHLPDGHRLRAVGVNVGNPHAVVFVEAVDPTDARRWAPQLATHPSFVYGVNVQAARVAGPHELELWIWERGAGETQASGTSAAAAAAAAVRTGRLSPGTVRVRMPGGSLEVIVAEDRVRLRGPVEPIAWGTIAPALWRERGR